MWVLGAFVFIVLPECIKAFRVCYETMYVMNPDGEIMVAKRRRPENWYVRKTRGYAGRIANSEIFLKVKSHRHDSLHALDHSLFGCVACINFARVRYVSLCLPTATSMLNCIRQLSFVRKLVHSSPRDINPCYNILWNNDTHRVGTQNVKFFERTRLDAMCAVLEGRHASVCVGYQYDHGIQSQDFHRYSFDFRE